MRPLLRLAPCLALVAACSSDPAPDAATPTDASDIPAPDAGDATTDAPLGDVPPQYDPFDPTPRGPFPRGFLWGSATAPYQIEGGLDNTDWAAWERMGRIRNNDRANDGPNSLDHYERDLDALVATHQNAYRFGVEWARLFPTRDAWTRCRAATRESFQATCRAAANPAGLAYYHRVLDAMRARNLTAMVTLQHFVLPDYLNDLSMPAATQGFARDGIVQDFEAWSRFVAGEYGAKVDWWITLNEPVLIVAAGYLQGIFPPGRTLDTALTLAAMRNMIHAHARAYDAIHEADTTVAAPPGGGGGDAGARRAAWVSIASHNRVFRPERRDNAEDVTAAQRAQYLNNRLFLNAIVRGDLDADGDGALTGPTDRTNDPMLRMRADYVGVNYYGLTLTRGARVVPLIGGLPNQVNLPTPLPKTDIGWDIYPQGFREVLHEVNVHGLPIVVTENGIADDAGVNRQRYIAEHLASIAAAIRAGDNVVGYFHWSIIDNFEWLEGYCPRFGLYRVDYASPMRTRTPTPGAAVLREIIDANEVSADLLTRQPAYVPPRPCGAHDGGTDSGMGGGR